MEDPREIKGHSNQRFFLRESEGHSNQIFFSLFIDILVKLRCVEFPGLEVAGLGHSHSSTRSKLHLRPMPQLTATPLAPSGNAELGCEPQSNFY